MSFLSKNPTSLFSKSILFYDELDNYERKIRKIQNEFAGALKQDQAAQLLSWIGENNVRN